MQLGAMLVAMLLVSMAFVPAVNAQVGSAPAAGSEKTGTGCGWSNNNSGVFVPPLTAGAVWACLECIAAAGATCVLADRECSEYMCDQGYESFCQKNLFFGCPFDWHTCFYGFLEEKEPYRSSQNGKIWEGDKEIFKALSA